MDGVKENGRYKYAFAGICPQDMRDRIIAELVFADEVILTAKEYTVYEYLTALLTKTAVELKLTDKEYEKLQTLVADTLYYGAVAQEYTGHNTDNMANEDVTVQPTDFVGPQGTVKSLEKHTEVEGVKFVAGGLYFKNIVSLYFKFTAVDPTEVTLKVKAIDVDRTYRFNDFEALPDDVYCIYTDGILPVDFGNAYTVELYHKGTLVQTFTYSVHSYVYSFKDKTGEQSAMAALAKRLYNYGVSAVAYFNAENYVISTQRAIKKATSVSFDIIGGNDVMPIGVWAGPNDVMILGRNETYTADYYFSQICDLGINCFPDAILATSENIGTLLNLCDKYGIAVELNYCPEYGMELTDDLLVEAKLLIERHPSAVGFRFPDELRMDKIKDYKELVDSLSEYDRYFNILPVYAEADSYGGDYEKYIAAFLELGIKYVSYDYYPFGDKGLSGTAYFENLAMMRKVTNEYDAAFWVFMQVGTVWGTPPEGYDSEASMLWNVNTTLAYGAKGIEYFTLVNQGFGEDVDVGTSSGIYNKHPFLNERAQYVKKANQQIKAIDHVLMNSYSDGVIFAGSMPSSGSWPNKITLTKPSAAYGTLKSYYELTGVSALHALVGCFNYNGKTALYVVNNSITQTDNVTLNFDNTYKYQVVQEAQGKYVVGNKLSLSLKAGEGVLVVLQ